MPPSFFSGILFFPFSILLFILQCYYLEARSCTSLVDIKGNFHQKFGKPFNQTLNGCIERVAFDQNKIVTEAYVRGEKVTRLGRDSVRNMVSLTVVSFYGCDVLAEIERGAFRNVPKLKTIQISYAALTKVPKDVFNDDIPSLETVRIHNNAIKFIQNKAFANVPSLKQIYAAGNKLQSWNASWFTNSTNLEIIDFQFNQIEKIPGKAFNKLKKLKQIFFDYNEISTIEPDAFQEIKRLDYLGLRYNRLTYIDERIFPEGLSVRSFLIDANYLNYLSNRVLEKITVKDLTLDGNPWKCQCLEGINSWIYRTNGTVRSSDVCSNGNVPVCLYPNSTSSKTCSDTVDSELTSKFLGILKKIDPPLDEYCARLK